MKLLTVNQAAQRMEVSTKTVYRILGHGILSKVKIGRSTRISENDLDCYLEKQQKKGKATW